jgi:hypothetical protein
VYKNRGKVQCVGCGGVERTRLYKLYIDRFAGLRLGLRVLHIAPEPQLFEYLVNAVGSTYEIRDINIKRYVSLQSRGMPLSDLTSAQIWKVFLPIGMI